jgi:hypothetical protein
MIQLTSILKENTDPQTMGVPYFSEFSKVHKVKASFKYIGLKNKEYIFTSTITDFGNLNLIISDAVIMARIGNGYAYFGVIYTLNGLEQFDATVCKMNKTKEKISVKLFDDSDPDFSDKNTNFAKLYNIMV